MSVCACVRVCFVCARVRVWCCSYIPDSSVSLYGVYILMVTFFVGVCKWLPSCMADLPAGTTSSQKVVPYLAFNAT